MCTLYALFLGYTLATPLTLHCFKRNTILYLVVENNEMCLDLMVKKWKQKKSIEKKTKPEHKVIGSNSLES